MANKGPLSGNKVSHSNIKTRRKFKPNLQSFTIESPILGRKINMRLSTATMRTLDKHAGLDGFLQNVKAKNLTAYGRKLRKQLLTKLANAS